jgi:hypothetical protein
MPAACRSVNQTSHGRVFPVEAFGPDARPWSALGEELMISDADLLPENFVSVNTICAYLRSRVARKA